jgi:rare lipoprotein A
MVEVESILPGAPPAVAETPRAAPAATPAAPAPPLTETTERQIPVATDAGGIYLQIAAFGSRDNAEAYAGRLRAEQTWLAAQLQVYTRDGLFRVHAGPYANHNDARQAADRISQSMGLKPIVLAR